MICWSTLAYALLVVLTCISYIPQYHSILASRSSAGLSGSSALINVYVAQIQTTTLVYLYKSAKSMSFGVPAAMPPSTRDWLVLTQISAQTMCSVLLLILIIFRSPSPNNTLSRPSSSSSLELIASRVAGALWILPFILFFASMQLRSEETVFKIICNIHAHVVNPVFTLLAIAAVFIQARLTSTAGQTTVLSSWTPGLQFTTFSLLAISWPFRFVLPSDMWQATSGPAILTIWYPWVGWACVNNAIFAIGQGFILLCMRSRVDSGGDLEGEPAAVHESHRGYPAITAIWRLCGDGNGTEIRAVPVRLGAVSSTTPGTSPMEIKN